jgi:hypothetical protein
MYSFKICNRIKLVCFLKFNVHKIYSEMMILTRGEKTDMTDTDLTMD